MLIDSSYRGCTDDYCPCVPMKSFSHRHHCHCCLSPCSRINEKSRRLRGFSNALELIRAGFKNTLFQIWVDHAGTHIRKLLDTTVLKHSNRVMSSLIGIHALRFFHKWRAGRKPARNEEYQTPQGSVNASQGCRTPLGVVCRCHGPLRSLRARRGPLWRFCCGFENRRPEYGRQAPTETWQHGL